MGFGKGRNDKFRNPRTAGGFVINSTELRSVNFMMEPLDKPPVRPRTTGRRAAVVSAPRPKVYIRCPRRLKTRFACAAGEWWHKPPNSWLFLCVLGLGYYIQCMYEIGSGLGDWDQMCH